jgi:putative FmdB family regulatory protein
MRVRLPPMSGTTHRPRIPELKSDGTEELDMPVYVYECDVCGERYELHRHFGSPHPDVCPKGHPGLHRVFSPPTIIFKGSGFYVTDNSGSNGQLSHSTSKEKESDTKPEHKTSKEKTPEASKNESSKDD